MADHTDIMYTPPYEARSLLLPVTTGCSYNRCGFCSMYHDIPFRTVPMAEIEATLRKAVKRYEDVGWLPDRVFLEHGDPFALSTDRLIAIADLIDRYFPDIATIGAYTSIHNLKDKSAEDLRRLRDKKYAKLDIGLESAVDDVLRFLNVGYTIAEAETQLAKLVEADLSFELNFILGGKGNGKHLESATAAATIINRYKPILVFSGSLHFAEGAPLYAAEQAGEFKENTVRELIEEQRALIAGITIPTIYFGLHVSNPIPLYGKIPQMREKMLARIDRRLNEIEPEILNASPRRSEREGGIVV